MVKQQRKGVLVWTTKFLMLTCTKYQVFPVNWSLTIWTVSLLPQSFPITKSLLKSVRCSWQRYHEFLREKESLWKQNAQCIQLAIIDREIEEVKDSIAESTKISKNFHAEFPRLPEEAEKKRNFELLSKGNALKRKSQEKQDEASKLEEALQVLQQKRRKIM